MPWEYFEYGAIAAVSTFGRSALDYIASQITGTVGDAALATGKKLFVERAGGAFSRKALADKFVKLNGNNLIAFYSSQKPLQIEVGECEYTLPVSEIIPRSTLSSFKIEFNDKPYEAPHELSAYVTPIKKLAAKDNRLFNGPVVRLDKIDISKAKIYLRQANYFDGLASNFAMDHQPNGVTQTLRDHVHGSLKKFEPFDSSLLANHIGVICMVESADGFLLAQKRSGKVAVRPNTISSSASGTLTPAGRCRR